MTNTNAKCSSIADTIIGIMHRKSELIILLSWQFCEFCLRCLWDGVWGSRGRGKKRKGISELANRKKDYNKGAPLKSPGAPPCYNHLATGLSPPLGDLGTTYDDHLRLVGKRVWDFLLVLIELFSLGLTAEALRAIIGSKSAIFAPTRAGWPKISGRKGRPHQPFFFSEKLDKWPFVWCKNSTYLSSVLSHDEVSNVKAATNNLQLNCSKSREIVFRLRRIRGRSEQSAPPLLTSWQYLAFSWITVSLQPIMWALNLPPVQVWCMHYVFSAVMVCQSNRWKMSFKQL